MLERIKFNLPELAFRNCTNHFILLQYSCGIYSKINLKNHFNVGVFLLLSFSKPILCGSSSNRVLSSTMFWILIHFPIMQKTSARCTKHCIMEQEYTLLYDTWYKFEWKLQYLHDWFCQKEHAVIQYYKFLANYKLEDNNIFYQIW